MDEEDAVVGGGGVVTISRSTGSEPSIVQNTVVKSMQYRGAGEISEVNTYSRRDKRSSTK